MANPEHVKIVKGGEKSCLSLDEYGKRKIP